MLANFFQASVYADMYGYMKREELCVTINIETLYLFVPSEQYLF